MRRNQFFAVVACAISVAVMAPAAAAQSCLEQIVALQARVKSTNAAQPQPPSEPQSVGAQLDRQPTPSSVAAASGSEPQLSGPAAALNAAQNYQAAGNEAACLKAVAEARAMLEGK